MGKPIQYIELCKCNDWTQEMHEKARKIFKQYKICYKYNYMHCFIKQVSPNKNVVLDRKHNVIYRTSDTTYEIEQLTDYEKKCDEAHFTSIHKRLLDSVWGKTFISVQPKLIKKADKIILVDQRIIHTAQECLKLIETP